MLINVSWHASLQSFFAACHIFNSDMFKFCQHNSPFELLHWETLLFQMVHDYETHTILMK